MLSIGLSPITISAFSSKIGLTNFSMSSPLYWLSASAVSYTHLKVGAVIIYDAAYEAYISEDDVPHTIYECDGAKTCAIELRSFSKNAGFTGTRLGFTVIPKELKSNGVMLNSLWARRHGTKFNGAPYIIQRAGEAVYSEAGKAQTKEQVAYYMNNAKVIMDGLKNAGFSVSGGVNAPYVWLETPDGTVSYTHLLDNVFLL